MPSCTLTCFSEFLEEHFNACKKECPNRVVTGDINIDLSKKGKCVKDPLHIHGMKNIVKEATCFKSDSRVALI